MPLPTYDIALADIHQLTENTIQLDFHLDDDTFDFTAGQFVSLRFDYENTQHKRSYSLACSPDSFRESGKLEIALGLIPGGKASECFSQATKGSQYILAGPAGVLTLPQEMPERLVLVGTGTGIAPYRAMLPSLEKHLQQGLEVVTIMGVRHRHDLFYDEDFKVFFSNYETARYEVCYSRESQVDKEISEYHGYVQHRFEHLDLQPGKDMIYLCGNPPMIDDSLVWLKNAGFNNKQIRREKYTFSR